MWSVPKHDGKVITRDYETTLLEMRDEKSV
jgi:hypothetical protein